MLRGIRGAITVKKDNKGKVLTATGKLLSEIVKQNGISSDDIASVIFTATPDLKATFPAEAARKIGWKHVPLLCAVEIDAKKSLKKCIRVLILVNTDKTQKEIKHVYLEGAKVLREDFE